MKIYESNSEMRGYADGVTAIAKVKATRSIKVRRLKDAQLGKLHPKIISLLPPSASYLGNL